MGVRFVCQGQEPRLEGGESDAKGGLDCLGHFQDLGLKWFHKDMFFEKKNLGPSVCMRG